MLWRSVSRSGRFDLRHHVCDGVAVCGVNNDGLWKLWRSERCKESKRGPHFVRNSGGVEVTRVATPRQEPLRGHVGRALAVQSDDHR